ncbi:MAG: hypothetical protein ACR2I7_10655 [Geodermatophilaceae bacterium]
MVQVEDSLVALASTDDQPAGLILRSDDGGLSWSQFETPLPEAIDGFDVNPALRPGPDLMLAGSWLVSFRSTSVVDEFGRSVSRPSRSPTTSAPPGSWLIFRRRQEPSRSCGPRPRLTIG